MCAVGGEPFPSIAERRESEGNFPLNLNKLNSLAFIFIEQIL